MKQLIVYGSQYGTAKRYAELCARQTGLPVLRCQDARDLSEWEEVIYFGALYAGGVMGLRKTVRTMRTDARLVIVTVGLADVSDQENIRHIRTALQSQVPESLLSRAAIFHLRGGIDYQKLNLKHRTVMALLYNKVKSMPQEQRNAETQALIDTYGKQVDFFDPDSLIPLMRSIRGART